MSKFRYQVEGPVYIVWVGIDDPLQNITAWTVWPETFQTRKQAVADVKEWVAEERNEGHESEYVR